VLLKKAHDVRASVHIKEEGLQDMLSCDFFFFCRGLNLYGSGIVRFLYMQFIYLYADSNGKKCRRRLKWYTTLSADFFSFSAAKKVVWNCWLLFLLSLKSKTISLCLCKTYTEHIWMEGGWNSDEKKNHPHNITKCPKFSDFIWIESCSDWSFYQSWAKLSFLSKANSPWPCKNAFSSWYLINLFLIPSQST